MCAPGGISLAGQGRDVIEIPVARVLDISGWDLNRALKLLYSSNPTMFEWFAIGTAPSASACSCILRLKNRCTTIFPWPKTTGAPSCREKR